MSSPTQYSKESDHLKYGFLAVKSSEAINRVLREQPLSDGDLEILSKASTFLQNIAEGAQLVSTGKLSQGQNSRESIEALDYAIDPLESLKDVPLHGDIADYFRQLAESVPDGKTKISISTEKRKHLEVAMDFFNALYDSLVVALGEHKRQSEIQFNRKSRALI